MSFKQKHAFEKRKDEAHRILQKYPERIPVICEKECCLCMPETNITKCKE